MARGLQLELGVALTGFRYPNRCNLCCYRERSSVGAMVETAQQVLGPMDGSLRSRRGDQPEGLGETLTGRGAHCVSHGILQLHSPLTTLSILFQNKVLTVDGVKVKLQVCPHVPGSISLAALGVQRRTKPLRGQRRDTPPKWGPTSILCGPVSCPGTAL